MSSLVLKNYLLAMTVAVCVSIAMTGCGARTPEEHLAAAKANIAAGELNTAGIELSSALQQDPGLVEARWLLARVRLDSGDGGAAEKEARKAVELGFSPGEAQLTILRAIVLQGDAERALAESRAVVPEVSPADQAAILGIRGQVFAETRQFDQATEVLQQALDIDSQSVPALVGMALLHAQRREYVDAREWADRALKAGPEFAESWSILGQIELEQGNVSEAEAALSKAVNLRRFAGVDLAKRALARALLDKFAEADADIAVLQKSALQRNPYVNYVSGVSLFRQQKYAAAIEAFEISKQDGVAYLPREYYLASAYLAVGRNEQALKQAELVSNLAPRSRTAAQLMGAVQINRSEIAAATDALSKALEKSPDDVVMLRMLGYVALLVGDAPRAVEHYEKAVTLAPDSVELRDSLALARLMNGQDTGLGGVGDLAEAATSGDSFSQEFLRALARFRDGDLKAAMTQARLLNSRYPDSVEPLKLMAACHLSEGQWETAATVLRKVLELQPNEPSAAKNLARLDIQADNLESARELLAGVVAAHPEDQDAVVLLARVEGQLVGLAAGIEVLEKAVERNPASLRVRTELATAYQHARRYDRVLQITRDVVAADFVKSPELLEYRGTALLNTGDAVSARSSFAHLVELLPDSAKAHYLHAQGLESTGDNDASLTEVRKAIELDPGFIQARVGEIKMLVRVGQVDAARDRMGVLRKEFAGRPEVLEVEGWFALGTEDFATAEARFAELPEDRQDAEWMVLYVRSLWGQKKHDEAISKMRHWLEKKPDDVAVRMHLAGAYLALEREDEAFAAYATVVEQQPDNIPALNNLAWLGRKKDPKQAIEYAERANRLAPNDPAVMDTFGMLLSAQGDKTRGHRLIVDAATRAPDDLDIQVHFANVLVEQGRTAEARTLLQEVIDKGGDGETAGVARRTLESLP